MYTGFGNTESIISLEPHFQIYTTNEHDNRYTNTHKLLKHFRIVLKRSTAVGQRGKGNIRIMTDEIP